MDFLFVLLGVLTGVIYACIGYAASGENFNFKKFLRTLGVVTLTSLGLNLAGLPFDIYSAMLEPTTITVFIEKLLNTARTPT